MRYVSTKVIPLGSCAFRQPFADSHCHFIHGYRLQAKFWFACSYLDKNNWVIDFGSLKGLKDLLEKQFDHTTIIAKNDPEISFFRVLHTRRVVDLREMDGVGIEKFAEYCFNLSNDLIKRVTNNRCWVSKVEVWEHENNSAIYEQGMSVPENTWGQLQDTAAKPAALSTSSICISGVESPHIYDCRWKIWEEEKMPSMCIRSKTKNLTKHRDKLGRFMKCWKS